VSELNLTNESKIQVVALKLDKSKPRELAFRRFLDQNDLNGVNRKETILKMFEYMLEQNILNKSSFVGDYTIKESEGISISNKQPDEPDINILKFNVSDIDVPKDDWGKI